MATSPTSSSPNHLRLPPPPSSYGAFSRKSADWTATQQHSLLRSAGGGGGGIASGNRRPQTELTIVIMGSTRVGKSAIVNQFLHGIFQEEYKETVDDMHWIEYDTNVQSPLSPSMNGSRSPEGRDRDGSTKSSSKERHNNKDRQNNSNNLGGIFLLKIIDASGSREFIGMRKLYEQQGDAFVLVIAVDDRDSFDEAKVIRKEIGERNRKNAPVIVVLTKIDLRDGVDSKVGQVSRSIDSHEVEQFARETDSLFVEATATRYDSVAEIFQRLLEHHSSIPSTAELKYRRKSVPISMSVHEFGRLAAAANSRRGTLTSGDHLAEDIPEEDDAEEQKQPEDKRQSCKIS